MFFQSILHSRHAAPLLLTAIILAAGGSIWEQGPGKARRQAQRNVQNVSTMKMVNIAAVEYAWEHDNKFPDADRWEQQLRPHLHSAIHDYTLVTEDTDKPHRIAINKRLAGHKMRDLKDYGSAALFFESTVTIHNAADELLSLPGEGQSVVIAYAAGHVYSHPSEWKLYLHDVNFHSQLLGELEPPKAGKITARN